MQAIPVGRPFLPATAQGAPPEPRHPFPQAVEVPRYRVVVEVALHDRPEPLAGLRRRIVHAPSELLLNFLQLRPQAPADRLAPHRESPLPVLPADVREAQEVERLGLAFPSAFPVLFGIPPELDPARFIRMQLQQLPALVMLQLPVGSLPLQQLTDRARDLRHPQSRKLRRGRTAWGLGVGFQFPARMRRRLSLARPQRGFQFLAQPLDLLLQALAFRLQALTLLLPLLVLLMQPFDLPLGSVDLSLGD